MPIVLWQYMSINSTHTHTHVYTEDKYIVGLPGWLRLTGVGVCRCQIGLDLLHKQSKYIFVFVCVCECIHTYITHEFVTWAVNGVFYDNYDPYERAT